MWKQNRFVRMVWRHGLRDATSYQYETDEQFVFEYLCCFSLWLLGLYNQV